MDLIHISEIDEYLAVRMVEAGGGVLSLRIEKSGEDGFIEVTDAEDGAPLGEGAVDFELSPSEYLNLGETEFEDLVRVPLITSSALELFDFILLRTGSFEIAAEFTGNAWKIKVLGAENSGP